MFIGGRDGDRREGGRGCRRMEYRRSESWQFPDSRKFIFKM